LELKFAWFWNKTSHNCTKTRSA